jgi:hypothetical protein
MKNLRRKMTMHKLRRKGVLNEQNKEYFRIAFENNAATHVRFDHPTGGLKWISKKRVQVMQMTAKERWERVIRPMMLRCGATV